MLIEVRMHPSRSVLHLLMVALLAPVLVTSAVGQEKKLLAADGWGSLSGRVVYKGDLPKPDSLVPKMQVHADKQCCLTGKDAEKIDPTWVVDPKTKGVANVLVYLRAPAGTYFPIHDDDKKRTDIVVIDQPHCAFVPHVVALFPSYFDGKEQVSTGQKFQIQNSAPVPHNTRATPDPLKNVGFNITLPPGAKNEFVMKPQRLPIMINCDIHPWMNARVGVYDHPYFAVTKTDGAFSLPRVPAGAEIELISWHEANGWVEGKDGRKLNLKAGKNDLADIPITAR
jgi:hypothetical protein